MQTITLTIYYDRPLKVSFRASHFRSAKECIDIAYEAAPNFINIKFPFLYFFTRTKKIKEYAPKEVKFTYVHTDNDCFKVKESAEEIAKMLECLK